MDKVEVLVVGDPEDLLALRGTISQPDYRLIEAQSGAEALKQVSRHDFALVLLNGSAASPLDGFETTQRIRRSEGSRDVPVIFLTANSGDTANFHDAYAAGAVDCLLKPVPAQILRAKVAIFVDLFRKGQRVRQQEARLRAAERLRGQLALKESESLYQATLDGAPVGIGHCLPDGRWLRVNPKLCDILGRSPEELLKCRLQDIADGSERDADLAALHRVVAGDLDAHRCERRCLRGDGRAVWVNLTISLLRDARGSPRHFVVVLEDATERRLAIERQRFLSAASESLVSSLDCRKSLKEVARLATLSFADWCVIDVAGDAEPIVAHAEATGSGEASRTWAKLSQEAGLQIEEVRRTGRPELVSDLANQLPCVDTAEAALVRRSGVASWMVVPIVARDRVVGTISVARGEHARRYGATDLHTIEDLGHCAAFAVENARLYREAREAVSARDEFLSIASHELRTPLTSLQIVLQSLLRRREKELSAEKVKETLVRSERQVRRLSHLVDNLLDVSRISAGRLELQRESVDLGEVVQEVVGRLGGESLKDDARPKVLTSPAVVGRWDRLRIEQVVTNLVANALKYGAKKPITVLVDRLGSAARLTIRDHGIGIAPDKINQIFNRFERAVSSRVYGGLGLGLYIVKRIVLAHGGTIRASSEPGAGAVFVVELPLEPAAVAPPAPAARTMIAERLSAEPA